MILKYEFFRNELNKMPVQLSSDVLSIITLIGFELEARLSVFNNET